MPTPKENSMGGCARAGSATAYVRDEIVGSEREEFERHLASCAACRDEAAAAREVIEHLLRSAPEDSDVDLVEGVLACIPEGAWKSPPRAGNGGNQH